MKLIDEFKQLDEDTQIIVGAVSFMAVWILGCLILANAIFYPWQTLLTISMIIFMCVNSGFLNKLLS